jgi:tetratricopeptide (TPR) repeat protein
MNESDAILVNDCEPRPRLLRLESRKPERANARSANTAFDLFPSSFGISHFRDFAIFLDRRIANVITVRLLIVIGVLLFAPGCAGFKNYFQPAKPGQSREERAAEAVKSFEERRDAVQIEAALDRFNQGDAARAEAMLSGVVNRRPDNAEARMRLGEVLWSRGDAAEAEPHFRSVLNLTPNRADAHHALGLLLDATGRSDEARQHLLKALELEPQNPIFLQTCDSLALRPDS